MRPVDKPPAAAAPNTGAFTPPAPGANANLPVAPPPPRPVLSAEDQARAEKAGCLPGKFIAPFHATAFYSRGGGRDLIADIGDPLEVDSSDPISGDRCNVAGTTPGGASYRGAVPLADIGPVDAVRTALNARAYNKVEDITLATLPQKLREGLAQRAQSLKLDPAEFNKDIGTITDFVSLCSEIAYDQLQAANLERAKTSVANDTFKKYGRCMTMPMGLKLGTTPRGILVTIVLRDDARARKYRVIVQFERKDTDGDRLAPTKTMKEAFLNYYDAYGIGNFYVSRQ